MLILFVCGFTVAYSQNDEFINKITEQAVEISKLKDELSKKDQEIATLKTSEKELNDELNESKIQVKTLTDENTNLRSNNTILSDEKKELEDAKTTLLNQVLEFKKKNTALNDELTPLKTEKNTWDQQKKLYKKADEKINDLEETVKAKDVKISNLETDKTNLTTKVSVLEKDVSAKDNKISNLENEKERLQTDVENLRKELSTLRIIKENTVNTYKNKYFDDLIKMSTKISVSRDINILGETDENLSNTLNDLKDYFESEELLSKKFNEAGIANAIKNITNLSSTYAKSESVKNLSKNLGSYKDFNEALKSTIEKLIKLDRKLKASTTSLQDKKFTSTMQIISRFIYDYPGYTEYPYLSDIVAELMSRKFGNANADVSDLFDKL